MENKKMRTVEMSEETYETQKEHFQKDSIESIKKRIEDEYGCNIEGISKKYDGYEIIHSDWDKQYFTKDLKNCTYWYKEISEKYDGYEVTYSDWDKRYYTKDLKNYTYLYEEISEVTESREFKFI